MSLTVSTVFVFILGTLLGSFLNVVIYRLPRRLSVVWPGSRCPHCQMPILAYDNIPLVSFLVLRGRCRTCGAPISWRYPLVEAAAGLLLAGLWLRFAPSAAWVPFGGDAVFVLMLVVVFAIDLDHQIVPNAITYPGLAAGLLLAILQGRVVPSVLAALGAGASFLLVAIVGGFALGVTADKNVKTAEEVRHKQESAEAPNHGDSLVYETERMLREVGDKISADERQKVEGKLKVLKHALGSDDVAKITRAIDDLQQTTFKPGTGGDLGAAVVAEVEERQDVMGGGDIKLAAMMGMFLSWPAIAVALMLAFTLGAAVGVLLLGLRMRTRKDPIPFGPMLAVGGVIALFASDAILHWYLGTL